MTTSAKIRDMTSRVIFAWAVVLSVVFAWTAGAKPQVAGLAGQMASLGVTGAPEQAATQVKTALAQRAADERLGVGPDPVLPPGLSGPAPVAVLSAAWVRIAQDRPADQGYRRQDPRAPPAA